MKELSLTIEHWWNDLDLDEQSVLIEMIYKMNGEDFREFGVMIKNDKYVEMKKGYGKN